ncbi:MAG: hypothetical protein WC718_16975 [Phycisphaerales bacterium]|jgi:hypothetical protein
MSVLPQNQNDVIIFCEAHAPVWAGTPASIGLTAAQVTALSTATTTARKSYNDAQSAREASKAKTIQLNNDVKTIRTQASNLIAQIKAFADLQASPANVYAAAQIPQPAAPTPLPAPGKPTDFSVVLNSDGSVTLSWDSTDSAASSGAFFAISRKLPGQGAFSGIGGAPGTTLETRRAAFTDATVPASAASQGAQYIVQGFRGTRMGEASDAVIVQFGVDSGGGFTSANVRLAA